MKILLYKRSYNYYNLDESIISFVFIQNLVCVFAWELQAFIGMF